MTDLHNSSRKVTDTRSMKRQVENKREQKKHRAMADVTKRPGHS